jgi:hypothetical protein
MCCQEKKSNGFDGKISGGRSGSAGCLTLRLLKGGIPQMPRARGFVALAKYEGLGLSRVQRKIGIPAAHFLA